MQIAFSTLSLALLASTIHAASVFTKFSELPQISFDYVVIGAGTAGNVIANRLSADPTISVLVIEAGPSDEGVLPAIAPLLGPSLTPNTAYDWNYTVAPQAGLNNRVFPFPRGHLLGGSSSANFLVHQYGSSDDYDKLATISGDHGWAWENMKKYVHKHERFITPSDDDGTEMRYIPEDHGTNGEVSITLPAVRHQVLDKLILAASRELHEEFPYNPDTSGGNNILGIGWTHASIANGTRQSSSTTYLRSAQSRPNLSVLVQTQALKLLPTSWEGGKPVFRGVLLSSGTATPNYVFATREVILSAGTIGTPQLLLLSGIGPKDDLESQGIRMLVDNASVGRNLSDHVHVPHVFTVNGQETLDDLFRSPARMEAAIGQWTATKDGIIANTLANQIGFFRLPSNASIFSSTSDPASGPKAPHWEIMVCNFWAHGGQVVPADGHFITLHSALISATSRGFVKLSSSDPLKPPTIDPKYLTTDFDKYALRKATQAIKRLASTKSLSDYIIAAYGSTAGETDEEIDDHIRRTGNTVFHPVGTGSISPDETQWGVVDSKLKVKGTEGLRVVDASVWPFVPSAHTQGPVYLLAERAADIINDGRISQGYFSAQGILNKVASWGYGSFKQRLEL